MAANADVDLLSQLYAKKDQTTTQGTSCTTHYQCVGSFYVPQLLANNG